MSEFLRTEEEQVAAIKQWWKDNGTSILVGIAVALAAIFGWRAWQQHVLSVKVTSSAQFQQLFEAATGSAGDPAQAGANIVFLADEIIRDNPASRYAVYARLMKARQAVAEARYEDAEKLLTEARQNNEDPALTPVINGRIARVLALKGDAEAALKVLDEQAVEGFAGYFDEIRGDILKAAGRAAEAREAYQRAHDAVVTSGTDARLLKMKLDDLAGR